MSAWRQPASPGFFQASVVKAKQGGQVQDTGEKVAERTAQEAGEAAVSVRFP